MTLGDTVMRCMLSNRASFSVVCLGIYSSESTLVLLAKALLLVYGCEDQSGEPRHDMHDSLKQGR